MNLFGSHIEKAQAALRDGVSAHALAVANLDAHDLAPADPGDAEAIKAHRNRRTLLAQEVEIAEGVVSHWRGVVANLEKEAAEKAKVAERAASEKEARANEALVCEIARDAEKLKTKLAKLEEHRARAKAAGVEDAEARVRRGPARTLPAITQTVTAWFGPDGTRYGSDMTHDAEGRSVKATDRVQREVVDVIRDEMTLPGEMPTRFADAITLVDLQGRVL